MPRTTGPRPGAPAHPSRELRERLDRAAELRAAGRAWAAVAEELGVAVGTAQGYPRRYPKLWASAERRAWDRALAEAAAEAVATLRRLLRVEDEKVRRDAAAKLVQFAARRLRPPGKKSGPSVHPLIAYAEGMSLDELTTHARDILSQHDGGSGNLDADTAGLPA